jgi:hypothetical protein
MRAHVTTAKPIMRTPNAVLKGTGRPEMAEELKGFRLWRAGRRESSTCGQRLLFGGNGGGQNCLSIIASHTLAPGKHCGAGSGQGMTIALCARNLLPRRAETATLYRPG